MLGKNIKNKTLTIVCDKKTEKYANYLRQLISMNDDSDSKIVGIKDGTVDVAVWLEKDYIDNRAKISSNQFVLFLGKNKTSEKEISTMNIQYNQFGMKYGCLGKRGMMIVDNIIVSQNDYDMFFESSKKYGQKFEHLSIPRTIKDAFSVDKYGVVRGVLEPVSTLIIMTQLSISKYIWEMIQDQQYRMLTVIYYLDALSEFLEG